MSGSIQTSLGLCQFYKKIMLEDKKLIEQFISSGRQLREIGKYGQIPVAKYGDTEISVCYIPDEEFERKFDNTIPMGDTRGIHNFLLIKPQLGKKYVLIPLGLGWEPTTYTLVYLNTSLRHRGVHDNILSELGGLVGDCLRRVLPELVSKKKALFGIDEIHTNISAALTRFDVYRFDMVIKNSIIGKPVITIRAYERDLNEILAPGELKLVGQWCTSSLKTWLDINATGEMNKLFAELVRAVPSSFKTTV